MRDTFPPPTESSRTGPVIDPGWVSLSPRPPPHASGHPQAICPSRSAHHLHRLGRTCGASASRRGVHLRPHLPGSSQRGRLPGRGTLRSTTDGETWSTCTIILAAPPHLGCVTATEHYCHSPDRPITAPTTACSWKGLTPPALRALLAAWADEQTIVIATANGQIATSTDTGRPGPCNKRIGLHRPCSTRHGTDGQIETILVADGVVTAHRRRGAVELL